MGIIEPYRCNQHVFDAMRLEEHELRECVREARARKIRPRVAIGVLFASVLGGLFVRAYMPVHRFEYRCHRVQVQYERDEGPTPPAASWTACHFSDG
jgi:hypothetical protein